MGPDLAKKHKETWAYFGGRVDDPIVNFQTNIDEVIPLLKDICTLKSSGIDEIASRLCKDSFLVLPEQITHIFNCSLGQGIFPDDWKTAKVVPLFKGGDRESVNNFRPLFTLIFQIFLRNTISCHKTKGVSEKGSLQLLRLQT